MLADPGIDERAFGDHLQPRAAHLVECALHQLRANAAAAKLGRHFGVDEGDDIAVELVVGGGKIAVDHELEAVMGFVVDDVAHDCLNSSWPQFFRESVSMARIDHGSPSLAPLMSSIFHPAAS